MKVQKMVGICHLMFVLSKFGCRTVNDVIEPRDGMLQLARLSGARYWLAQKL